MPAEDRHPVERIDGRRHPDHRGQFVVGENPARAGVFAFSGVVVGQRRGDLGQPLICEQRTLTSSVMVRDSPACLAAFVTAVATAANAR
jgi:hypothetical protein